MTAQRRSQVGERKIFSTMGFGESSRGIVAEIADMRFPNNRLRNWHFRHAIGIPTFGIGARQVDDHASTAVHASRVRPWIGNASHFGNSGGNDGRTAVISTFKHLANDRQTEKAFSLSNVYKVVKKSQYFNVYTQ